MMPNYLITVSGVGITKEDIDVTVNATTNPFSGGGGTGVDVIAGQELTFTSNPADTWVYGPNTATQTHNADGDPSVTNGNAILPSAQIGALVGKIGSGGSWFLVGVSSTITAGATGELYLVLNDIDAYLDNSGTIDVNITPYILRADAFFSIDPTGVATAWGGAGGIQFNGANVPLSNASPAAYNPSHIYSFMASGTGSEFEFNFADTDGIYTDNSGSLNVTIEQVS